MKDITIIIPVHKFYVDEDMKFFERALESVKDNRALYSAGKLPILVISSKEELSRVKNIVNATLPEDCDVVCNDGETDFCSQVNCGAKLVKTDFFSILEYDDEYTSNWFHMAHRYFFTNEDVSVFLPINVEHSIDDKLWQFKNEMVWASSFSNELGFIDFDCLQNFSTFNLNGGIINTNDFLTVGGLKSSVKAAFNYEFFLRLTAKKLKVFVVPKEGYKHLLGRKNSLMDIYNATLDEREAQRWFEFSKTICHDTEDKNATPPTLEEVK